MQTITLRVDENISDKFMWFLSHFDKKEIEILDNNFVKNRAYLQDELEDLESGNAKMLSEEEFWNSTEETISRHES